MFAATDQLTAPVNEFARLSGLGVSTVWAMVHDGRLETVAIGRRRLVVIESYRRLIEQQRAAPVKSVMTAPIPKGRPRQAKAAAVENATHAK